MKSKILIAFFIFCHAGTSIAENSVYISGKAGKSEANSYTKAKNISSRYLAYRDLGPWLKKLNGKQALDFGSGLGFSSEYLLQQGLNVRAADINLEMIQQARSSYPSVNFSLIENNRLPFEDQSFDLVFSSLVLFELSSLKKIQEYAAQAKRVLKDNGYFIGITGSLHMHDPSFKSSLRNVDFPENRNAKSGSLVRVHLNEINLTFSDYLWFEKDYREAFSNAGLPICEVHYPLGKKGEDYPWEDELKKSPFLLILAAKNCPTQLR